MMDESDAMESATFSQREMRMQLDYLPRRDETFVAYLWGKNTLFDDYFQGSGTVIQQQVTGGKRNPIARFWESIFGAIGKVFGI